MRTFVLNTGARAASCGRYWSSFVYFSATYFQPASQKESTQLDQNGSGGLPSSTLVEPSFESIPLTRARVFKHTSTFLAHAQFSSRPSCRCRRRRYHSESVFIHFRDVDSDIPSAGIQVRYSCITSASNSHIHNYVVSKPHTCRLTTHTSWHAEKLAGGKICGDSRGSTFF